jgi:hypothetical protein
MVRRYVKAQLWVLLCGGMVGPIFLAVFFGTGQDPLLKWMFWAGLVMTAADVLIALAIAGYGARAAARSQYLEQRGVLALADVTEIRETGARVNNQPLVTLDLRIEGPGIASFTARDRVLASMTRTPMIMARRLVVIADPVTHSFEIDWNRSALINGMAPAQFTLDEDNRTYDLSGQVEPLMEIMRILKSNNVPLSRVIDIRSNPGLRQQVMNVVRRAAATPAPPQSETVPSYLPVAPEPTTAARLQELETLRATGVITEAEYTGKRQQIIAEL